MPGSGTLPPASPIGLPLPQINYVAAMTFSPDSKILATGGYDRAVRLWDTATGAPIGPVLPQRDIVLTLWFSPNGRTLAVGHAADYSGSAGTVLWDVATRKPIGPPMPGPNAIIRFSPDGRRVLTATESIVRLWDAGSGAPLGPVLIEPAAINQVVFRPDGQMILLGCADGTVRLRDPSTGKTIGAPMLHPFQAHAVAFSPDPQGKLILAGYADGSARLWDRATQKPLGAPVFQSSAIYAVTFAPDGRSFVTTSADGNTRCWPVPTATSETVDQIALRLQVRTALEMGEGQTVVQLAPAEWQRRRQLLAARDASSTSTLTFDRAFHEARARDAEQDGDWFAAKWHLDHLIAAQNQKPEASAWLLYARRARCQLADGAHVDQAAAEYERALKRGSRQELSNWYRHCQVECRSAKNWTAALWYLDQVIAAEPNDWQLFADRAIVHEKLDRRPEREADRSQAVKLGADSSFLLQLSEDYAQEGEWKKSAASMALARERGDTSIGTAQSHALLCLKADDLAGYRQVCAGIVAKAAPMPSVGAANTLAWVCAIGPDAVADYTKPVASGELAVRLASPGSKYGVLNTLGAILYRAGRYREAITRLNEGIHASNGDGGIHDWIFLAMAHHRLDETIQARKFLAKAIQYPLDNQPVFMGPGFLKSNCCVPRPKP